MLEEKKFLLLDLDKIKTSGKLELFRKFMNSNNLFAYSEILDKNLFKSIDEYLKFYYEALKEIRTDINNINIKLEVKK